MKNTVFLSTIFFSFLDQRKNKIGEKQTQFIISFGTVAFNFRRITFDMRNEQLKFDFWVGIHKTSYANS